MNSFINNLIDRSVTPATNVMPRLRGKFERTTGPLQSFTDSDNVSLAGVSQPANETNKELKRIDLKVSMNAADIVREHTDTINRPLPEIDFQKTDQQSVTGLKPERLQRLQPSLNLVVQAPPQGFSETKPDSQSQKITTPRRGTDPENAFEQKRSPVPTPETSTSVIISSGEIERPPLVKPNSNNTVLGEPQQKVPPKQSPLSPFIQRLTAKEETSRTINISIGRIEVRVSQPPKVVAKPKREVIPIMGLDEYLQKRNQQGQ